MNDIHIPIPCWLNNTQCNFQWVSKSRVTPDSYHSTLRLRDNHDRVFSPSGNRTFRPTLRVSYIHIEISDISTGLLHPHRNFKYFHESLTPTQKFRISPQVSYTHTEILDISTGLLHPHRNFGYLHGSLTPTQKFGISPRVSYTHTEIRDTSLGLLHPHRNLGYPLGSLTPTQKFGIPPWVSCTHTRPFGYYRESPSPKIQAFSPEGINGPLLVSPNTH